MIIEDLDIIKRLIAEKEGGLVEFKETTGQLERGMETLCAPRLFISCAFWSM